MKQSRILQVIIGIIILVITYTLNLPWLLGVILWFVGFALVGFGLFPTKKREKNCPKCGWEKPKDANECLHCGFKFVD